RVSVFIASHPNAEIRGATRQGLPLGSGVQIADSCRWWGRSPRCQRPNVLHVDADGRVRPCWHGPSIGSVGDSIGSILNRSAALASAAGAWIKGSLLQP